MKIRKKFYPYPVLAYFNDDINGEFNLESISVSLSHDKSKYIIEGTIQFANQTIEEMLNEDRARLILHVECAKTRYREVFSVQKKLSFVYEIGTTFLEGNVDLKLLIVSNEKINNYINNECHPDFKNTKYKVEVGQILAICEPMSFFANKDINKIINFPSIFSIIRNPSDKEKAIDYDLEENKITIMLSEENYFSYRTLKNNSLYQPILSAMILVPVLSSVLYSLSLEETVTDYSNSTWLASIKKRMDECDLDFEKVDWETDSLSVANILVGDPLSYGLTKIREGEE